MVHVKEPDVDELEEKSWDVYQKENSKRPKKNLGLRMSAKFILLMHVVVSLIYHFILGRTKFRWQ